MKPFPLPPSLSLPRSLLPLAALALATAASACSDCGCSLSSDWAAQGYDVMPGFGLGLRYD